jgi:type IV secretion system protein VirB5
MKNAFGGFVLAAGMMFMTGSQAQGIPVIDGANLAQNIQTVLAWGKQFQQMQSQLGQMEQQYKSLSGVRGMADLVNNPTLRNYMPSEYSQILNNTNSPSISGAMNSIKAASKIIGLDETKISPDSDTGKAFSKQQDLNATMRAVGEEGYRQASKRFSDIQKLLDKVNDTPDQKDVLDLQARIQAEQVMMQNEQNKLNTMTYLAQVQRDQQQQTAREISIKAGRGQLAPGW